MQRQTRILSLAVLALVLVWSLPTLAGTKIDETRKVDKDATITIESLAGQVTVTGWNKNEVKITGTLDPKAEELSIEGGDDALEIKVEYPDRIRNINEGSNLEIMVPQGCMLEVETVSADITVDKVNGEVELQAVSGIIDVRGEPSELTAETVSGRVDMDIRTDTASLACVSGDIVVKGVRKNLECGVVSGSITIDAGKEMESLECETISGEITVDGELPRGADWSLAAHSGDITLTLSGKVDAEFSIETFSGDIDDAFGHKARRTSKYAPGRELEFTEGDGNASVEVESFSGDVKIRKR